MTAKQIGIDSSGLSHLVELLQNYYRPLNIYRKFRHKMSHRECAHGYYCIMYCKIIGNFTLLSSLCRSNGLYKPSKDAVQLLGQFKAWRAEFPRDDAIHSKWTRAVITKLQHMRWKETMGASLKHFELGCLITEGVKCREASKALFRTQARSGPVVLSTLFHESYLG